MTETFTVRGIHCKREPGINGGDIVTPVSGPQWRMYFLPGKPFDVEQVGKAIDVMPLAEAASEIFEKSIRRQNDADDNSQ